MLDTFSPETLAEIKAELTPEEAAQLGDSFEEFFYFLSGWFLDFFLHPRTALIAY